jgi:hypothetical protein
VGWGSSSGFNGVAAAVALSSKTLGVMLNEVCVANEVKHLSVIGKRQL